MSSEHRAASSLASELMETYKDEDTFNSVRIKDTKTIVVSLALDVPVLPKNTEINGVAIKFVAVKNSERDLKTMAEEVMQINPDSTEIEVVPDLDKLTVFRKDNSTNGPVRKPKQADKVTITTAEDRLPTAEMNPMGGQTNIVGGGICTSGFRVNGAWTTTAAHCYNGTGSQVGYADGAYGSVSTYGEWCYADTQTQTSPIGSVAQVRGDAVTASGDPAFGDWAWHFGHTTTWSWGYYDAWSLISNTGDCQGQGVWTMTIGQGAYAHAGGDSGGPYVQWNGSGFTARGTHWGAGGGSHVGRMVPISTLNAIGLYVY